MTARCLLPALVALALPVSARGDITTDLMARWSFSGNADDASGNGNHGIVWGGTALTTDRFGTPGSAYYFSAMSSDYIEIPSSASLSAPTTAMTMAAWILMASDGSGWHPILMKSFTGENAFMYRMLAASTFVCVAFTNWNVSACTGAAIPLNEWHHVATTWDGLTVRFYLDGLLVASAPLQAVIAPDTRPLTIGADVPGSSEWFHGKIDEVNLYSRALSASCIAELYAAAPTGVPVTRTEDALVMSPPFPNPARGHVTVSLQLAGSQPVRLGVYDAAGRAVAHLVDGTLAGGQHALQWNAGEIASGVYFLRLDAAGKSEQSRVVLTR
jgi:hypothetical protein